MNNPIWSSNMSAYFQGFLYLNFNIVLYLQEVELGAALKLRCIGRKSA